mgnify:FL=1|jgi:MoaA/NifB/PqqE/SkfB family radical SAM enzyme
MVFISLTAHINKSMIQYKTLTHVHIEITNRCQASCPMCSRNFHGGMPNPLLSNGEWSVGDFKNIFTPQLLKQLTKITFCGNFGDPLINPDFEKMLEYIKDYDLYLDIHTNGSFYNAIWWKHLSKKLTKQHKIVFALDGLSDTHSRYRIGTDFNKIITNAKSFIHAGGTAEWSFIKFKHNAHQVTAANALADAHGFKYFTVKNSSRFAFEDSFDVYDKNSNVVDKLEPVSTQPAMDISNVQKLVDASEISCYAAAQHEVYIDAHLNLFPCCFLASVPYNFHNDSDILYDAKNTIKEQHLDLVFKLGNTNLKLFTVEQIINRESYQTVWNDYWTTKKLYTCARTCGNIAMTPMQQYS